MEPLADPGHSPLALRGLAFLECETLEEAVTIASGFKPVPGSRVELRPALMLDTPS